MEEERHCENEVEFSHTDSMSNVSLALVAGYSYLNTNVELPCLEVLVETVTVPKVGDPLVSFCQQLPKVKSSSSRQNHVDISQQCTHTVHDRSRTPLSSPCLKNYFLIKQSSSS